MVMTILIFDAVGTLSVLQVVFLLQRHTGYFLIQVTSTEYRCQNCEKKPKTLLSRCTSPARWSWCCPGWGSGWTGRRPLTAWPWASPPSSHSPPSPWTPAQTCPRYGAVTRDSKGISQQNCYSEFSSTILSHPELANTAFEPPPHLLA